MLRPARVIRAVAFATVCFSLFRYLTPSQSSRKPTGRYTNAQQRAIVEAAVETWHDYREHGFGSDEFGPISKRTDPPNKNVLGWMIVDSLDTFMLMGIEEYVEESTQWITDHLNYDIDENVNLFETTIRMLGGLLGAYHLCGKDIFLTKSVELADRLMPAFNVDSHVPGPDINLKTGFAPQTLDSSTAEATTLQLEFKYLSHLTKNATYWQAVERVMQAIDANKPKDGLVPIYLSSGTGHFTQPEIRLGSRGDSYYEYLIKQYLQTNGSEPIYKSIYDEAVAGIRKHLVAYSSPHKFTFIGELPRGVGGPLDPKMDHLVCFAGSMFAIGATNGLKLAEAREQDWWTEQHAKEFKLGEEITRTCVATYFGTYTGLAPEIVVFNTEPDSKEDFYIKPLDVHNLQRPETVESIFYLYRLTGDQKYRDWGWQIFESFRKHSRTDDGGYTSLDSVVTGEKRDSLESFWLAETLKYLYLLFDDEGLVDLKNTVFNTEAHPLPVFDREFDTWERE